MDAADPSPEPLSWTEVDLEAVRANLSTMSDWAGLSALCVVKADAYGHGATEVARELHGHPACRGFVVARLEEAVALRRSLGEQRAPRVLCLGVFPASRSSEDAKTALRVCSDLAIEPVVSSAEDAGVVMGWSGAAGRSLAVHLAVDTGMGREGVELARAATVLDDLATAAIPVASVFTHFSESEVTGSEVTRHQEDRFLHWLGNVSLPEGCEVHLSNSAGALRPRAESSPDSHPSLLRVGGALYGLDLRDPRLPPGLRPALSVRSRLVQVREVSAGSRVGYNGRWRAERDSLVGLVPIGYADGLGAHPPDFLWLGGEGAVRIPVVGSVSMDLATVDLTAVRELRPEAGDGIVVLGAAPGGEVRPVDAREHLQPGGGPLYSVTVAFSRRLPRYSSGSAPVIRRKASR